MCHLASILWRCHRSPGLPRSSWAWTRPSSAGTGSRSYWIIWITGHGSEDMDSKTWIAGHGLQDMDSRTWIAGQGSQDRDCRTRIAGHGLQDTDPRTGIAGHGSGRVNLIKHPPQRISCQSGLRHPIELKFFLVHLNTHTCQKT